MSDEGFMQLLQPFVRLAPSFIWHDENRDIHRQ